MTPEGQLLYTSMCFASAALVPGAAQWVGGDGISIRFVTGPVCGTLPVDSARVRRAVTGTEGEMLYLHIPGGAIPTETASSRDTRERVS